MPHDHPSHDHHHDQMAHGHNGAPKGYAAWELPRDKASSSADGGSAPEPDFDLVERSFVDGAHNHPDPTSFLRLASVPFHARLLDGSDGYLLGYVIEDVVEVGAVMPTIGDGPANYNVVPASRLAKRRHLFFQYWTKKGEIRLSLAQARGLKALPS